MTQYGIRSDDEDDVAYRRELRRHEAQEQARKIVEDLFTFLNRHDQDERQFLLDEIRRQHRTLQQIFTGVVFNWLQRLGKLKEYEYDLRNDFSVQLAHVVVTAVEAKWGKFDDLPHI